jgi:hypothetical protein
MDVEYLLLNEIWMNQTELLESCYNLEVISNWLSWDLKVLQSANLTRCIWHNISSISTFWLILSAGVHDYLYSFLTPLTTKWRMIMACLLLQIVWRKLMLSKCLGMLFSRMGNTHDSLIPWKSFTQILLAEAFTMGVLFRGWEKRLPPFLSIGFFLYFTVLVCSI